MKKKIYIQLTLHNALLELPSLGTIIIKRLERQNILFSNLKSTLIVKKLTIYQLLKHTNINKLLYM